METVQRLVLVLTLVVSLAAIFHRRIKRGHAQANPQRVTVKVRDPVLARQTLIDQAAAFSNRPSSPFPVPLISGRRLRGPKHGITTVPYGPHWRALRSNLTAAVLHPWRLGHLAPLHRDAVEALVSGLIVRARPGSGGHAVVVVRDSVYPAVFALLARLCFGDGGVHPGHMNAMQHMMQEFRVAIGEARDFAGSMVAKLVHWRRWRRFLSFRSRQAALFLPLIAARRRESAACGKGSEGAARPYIDSLIDLRVPDMNNDDAKETRGLTEDEMVSLVVEFLGAAESIVACLEWTLAHLTNRPEVQEKLHSELTGDGYSSDELLGKMPYLHAVVLESLRLHPPFPLALRDIGAEGAVAGNVSTPPGGVMKVYFKLQDIGRDGKTWTQPGEFRPERFLPGGEGDGVSPFPGAKDIRMMPFGAGHRACPGTGMGVMFIKCYY